MSLAVFLSIPYEANTIVFFDEIEHMLMKSFKILHNVSENVSTCFYLPAQLAQWGQIIGFTGTMGAASAQQINWSFLQAINFAFPSLRKHGSENKLTEVIKIVNSDVLPFAIWTFILKMSSVVQNFIVICKDLIDLDAIAALLEV